MPVQYAPVIEYPRGLHGIDSSSRCRVAVAQHAVDYALTCESTYRH